ncbi:(2Fe-2S)-binding protein [Rhodobacteraceae bacterium 2376]|uniref:(2Fe-2S)-binding protein n=1 Tax=Rhabdonatronobacter sediminivivens TaxID=2743469 RepID=A0A7Z0KXI5_9RHOB|nr:(2Fe-2S)-binding protein [Rhabdonatronobacter sediminivivens]NYS24469.1 (2Fe-2S)-binding protein [Rhabdonatronobacter sediminivivens]
MIVCHCATISSHEIRAAVDWMRAADPETIITPGKIYRALGKRADCGGCLPVFLAQMEQCDTFGVPDLRGAARFTPAKGVRHEGRRKGHRVSEQGFAQ